ncbi:MAG TPA: thrombospondin type 3 repeat-containing protein, partial [Verrucomicrobiae bacterium]
ADGDGMWDIWETNYFGNVSGTNFALVLPGADADGDGMSNRDEYIAGTNPTNALSLLKIVLTATNANVLQFVAQTNLSYSVICRTNLAIGSWNVITNVTLSTNLVRTITVHTATGPVADERYYRVVTPRVP